MSKEKLIAELRISADDNTNRLTHKAVDLVERLINQEVSAKVEESPAYRAPEVKDDYLLGCAVLGLALIILFERVLPWL